MSRKNKNGTTTAYLQLAHNEWDPGAKYAKAKVIYSFGREDEVDRHVHERLVQSIARYLSPEAALQAQNAIGDTAEFLFQSSKRLGGSWMLHQLWKKIGLDAILEKLFSDRNHQASIDDLVQVVIGLAVTREGIPIRSWVWPGNTSDMSVVDEVKKDLIGWKLGRVVSVMDRGFSSEANLRTLQKTGGHYIVGEKMHSGKETTEEAMSRKGRYHQVRENLQVKDIIVGDGEGRKRYVLVYNPKEAERDRICREQHIEKLQGYLAELKQLDKSAHTKAACRLRTHATYGKYIRQLKDGTPKLDKQAIRDAEKYDGKYLIRTSDDTLSAEDVALGYKQLVDVEDAFRTLKTTLVLRPMFHRLEDRIRSHILISWLALLLVRIVEVKTDQTWSALRKELERIHLGHFSSINGDVYQSTELTAEQRKSFAALEIEPPPRFLEIHSKV